MVSAVLLTCAAFARAGHVVLDGTVGPAGPRLGPNFVIPQSVGRLQGTNLFHSFSQFDVDAGESATFTANPGTPISNIIARVTGPTASNINGLVRSDIANANLFLINPNGIMFGPSAQLDVQGSFVASSGSYVKLADGVRFTAVAPADAVLTSAPPAAFGFLGKGAGPVTYTAPARATSTGQAGLLAVPQGKSISLIGGPVRIDGGNLQSLGGQVNLVSAAGKGEVALDTSTPAATPMVSQKMALGPVQIIDGAMLAAAVGGGVAVRSGSLQVDASSIIAATDVVKGGDIDLSATGTMSLLNSRVSADTSGAADAGSIRIAADTLAIVGLSGGGFAPISVDTSSTGRGGDVTISVGSLDITKSASVQAFTTGPGAGGSISVNARRNVVIDGTGAIAQTGLAAETRNDGSGPGGNVSVHARRVDLINEGEITSLTTGTGNAGVISVAAGTLFIDGHNAPLLTGLQGRVGEAQNEQGASGNGGAIVIKAGRVELRNGGVITASTFGSGPGGSVDLTAGNVRIAGSAKAPFTAILVESLPVANVTSPGTGGSIRVKADNLSISGPAEAANGMPGIAGMSVQAPIGQGGQPQGKAGNVIVSCARNLLVLHGGTISARGYTGGSIRLDAGGFVYLNRSIVTAQATKNGASLLIDPPAVVLNHRSTINGLSGGVPVIVQIHGDLLKSPDSRILTNSMQVFPQVDLTGQLVPLPAGLAEAGAALAPSCAARLGGDVSSFIVTGRGGVAPLPDAWQPDWILLVPPR